MDGARGSCHIADFSINGVDISITELVAYIFQKCVSSRYTCSSNEMDLSYAFRVLKELEKCYGIWE